MNTPAIPHAVRCDRSKMRANLRREVERLRPQVNDIMHKRFKGVHNLYHQKSPADIGGHIDLHFFNVAFTAQSVEYMTDAFRRLVEVAEKRGLQVTVKYVDTTTEDFLHGGGLKRHQHLIVSFQWLPEATSTQEHTQ